MVRYLIVDDEAPGRTNLRLALGAHPDWVLVSECESAAQARADAVPSHSPAATQSGCAPRARRRLVRPGASSSTIR